MRKLNTRGFTIIELLIATVTFSVILLIITGAIIQFSKVYYKGVVNSRTQEAARSVVDEMSKAAQFSPDFKSDTNPASGLAWCFGNKRFSFVENTLLDTTNHVLVADTSAACDGKLTALNPDARELLGQDMKLLDLEVTPSQGNTVFTIVATVGYGSDADPITKACPRLNLGGQFCAVNTIKSTVTRRL